MLFFYHLFSLKNPHNMDNIHNFFNILYYFIIKHFLLIFYNETLKIFDGIEANL